MWVGMSRLLKDLSLNMELGSCIIAYDLLHVVEVTHANFHPPRPCGLVMMLSFKFHGCRTHTHRGDAHQVHWVQVVRVINFGHHGSLTEAPNSLHAKFQGCSFKNHTGDANQVHWGEAAQVR